MLNLPFFATIGVDKTENGHGILEGKLRMPGQTVQSLDENLCVKNSGPVHCECADGFCVSEESDALFFLLVTALGVLPLGLKNHFR